uniref:Uncharacterized protein n=1 Tax=Musca domestica TaxID=7370 RepID=A0A1I8NL60_MUSDO
MASLKLFLVCAVLALFCNSSSGRPRNAIIPIPLHRHYSLTVRGEGHITHSADSDGNKHENPKVDDEHKNLSSIDEEFGSKDASSMSNENADVYDEYKDQPAYAPERTRNKEGDMLKKRKLNARTLKSL